MSTSPWHPVFPHGPILNINEVVEPTVLLKIVTHVFELRIANIQNWFITIEHLDEELASLSGIQTLELGLLKYMKKIQEKWG